MNTEMISDNLSETQPKQILRELNDEPNAKKGTEMSHTEKVNKTIQIIYKKLGDCSSDIASIKTKYDELNSTIEKHHTDFKDFTSNIISDALWE